MPERHSFDYAVVRVVPHVEREEFVNAGVVLICHTLDFLGARIGLDTRRLLALAPEVDLEEVQRHLDAIPRIAAGSPAAGPIARLRPAERFHWLTSPGSTIIQPSAVHSGLCDDPEAALEHLMDRMVRPQELPTGGTIRTGTNDKGAAVANIVRGSGAT